jgi:hypothetical protein
MAKKSTAVTKVEQHSGVVPVKPSAVAPSFLPKTGTGRGLSSSAEDNLVPLIYILQALSPAVNKRKPEYIEGAEPGAIWLRNSASPIVIGETGILVQPCYFSKDWVEWVPRDSGGGFVGRHPSLPADCKKIVDEKNPNKVKYIRKNKNEVIETRYHVVRVFTDFGVFPYVIPMAGSGHTVSKAWMFTMNSVQLPGGGKADCFAKLYRLKTKERTNASGTWFTWDIESLGWVSSQEDYEAGKALFEAFSSGEKAIEAEVDKSDDDAM